MDKMKNVIAVASGNARKAGEIRNILKGYEFVPMSELGFTGDIEEDGTSFKENALIKAKAVCAALVMPALSDDSGLCVDALGGAPGIYSKRYSGGGSPENRALLLKNLEGVTDRRAHFCCCVCLCLPDGSEYYGEGKTYGTILTEERGRGGFGYDCLFLSDDLGKTFGEASEEEKDAVSHRGRALRDLGEKIRGLKI